MSGELLFSLRNLNFLNVIFKKSNVPLQEVNQVFIPLYDLTCTNYQHKHGHICDILKILFHHIII